jgi:hydrogenase nickel incorporation protein HypA/HybF
VHELSIAQSLVEVAESAAREANAQRVITVHLRIGKMAGIVLTALEFGYEIVTQGTMLEGSRLEVVEVPVTIFCPQCQKEVELDGNQLLRCPECATLSADVRQGRELELASLEIE